MEFFLSFSIRFVFIYQVSTGKWAFFARSVCLFRSWTHVVMQFSCSFAVKFAKFSIIFPIFFNSFCWLSLLSSNSIPNSAKSFRRSAKYFPKFAKQLKQVFSGPRFRSWKKRLMGLIVGSLFILTFLPLPSNL